MLQTVARVSSRAFNFGSTVTARQAVVVEDFLCDHAISRIDTAAKAKDSIGDLLVHTRVEETTYFRRHGTVQPVSNSKSTSLRRYLNDNRDTRLIAFGDAPEGMTELFHPPHYLSLIATNPPEPIECTYYMGIRGLFTHLHFDEHMYDNFLYQVFGEKRIFLFSETCSDKLCAFGNQSRVAMEVMTDTEKMAFTHFAGGSVVAIGPGDALYIPAGMWHYVDYVSDALSVSLRFGRSQHVIALIDALGYYHASAEFLHVASALAAHENVDPRDLEALKTIEAECARPYDSFSTRYQRLQRLFEQLCAQRWPSMVREMWWQGDVSDATLVAMAALKRGVGRERYLRNANIFLARGDMNSAISSCRKFLELRHERRDVADLLSRLERGHMEDVRFVVKALATPRAASGPAR